MLCLRALLLPFLFTAAFYSANAQGTGNSSIPWLTLHGDSPLVVAYNGLYGMFPPSSDMAYSMAALTCPSAPLWCDVQLSRDAQGFCFPNINLANASDVGSVFGNMSREHWLNGNLVTGWFASDFTIAQILENLTLYQDVLSRTPGFDGLLRIQTVENVVATPNRTSLWLNIEHSLFFSQQNLSMRSYVISLLKDVVVDYVSSPERQFLQSIRSRIPESTRLVYKILGRNEADASTNLTYGSILRNLSSVKTFADGILVDKSHVYPTADGYLQKPTSLVSDAHSIGLQVFASGFDNDVLFSYNASYSPVQESIFFIANGEFAVDGIVSPFPITASSAIGCYSNPAQNTTINIRSPLAQKNPLVISYGGASGDYPSSTDIAFRKAIEYGVDIIDCSVHLTSDGVPVCAASINLIETTDVLNSSFRTLMMSSVPGLSTATPGIFTFNLTWKDIQTLTPMIQQPFLETYGLRRNPENQNSGKMVTLSEFLEIARNGSVPGVLIDVENAAFLAERLRVNVTGIVAEALFRGGFENSTTRVMIQSSSRSVLEEFRGHGRYELVYAVLKDISGLDSTAVDDIRSFASSVVLNKHSLFPASGGFITAVTDLALRFHSWNISVYVQLFSNEFVSQSWDFFADSLVEINSFVSFGAVDGIVTDYPRTGNMFKNNRCSGLSADLLPPYMAPVQPGSLLTILSPTALPPVLPPSPLLQDSDVSEPPLTPVNQALPPVMPPPTNRSSAVPPSPSSSGHSPRFISTAAILVSACVAALVTITLI